jgi:DNA-binding GntR family transcriptional regulator
MRAAVSTVEDALPISPLEERESVERRVAAVLRELIVSGQLREGTPLVHRELEDFEEIYAARLGSEGLAARLGAPAVSDAALSSMREMLERLRVHAAKHEVDEYLGLRWEFHATCYRSSGRTRLVDEVERLYRRSERYNRLVLASPERFRESVARYGEFLAACEARDGDAAERIIHTAMRWAVDRLAPTLPSERD